MWSFLGSEDQTQGRVWLVQFHSSETWQHLPTGPFMAAVSHRSTPTMQFNNVGFPKMGAEIPIWCLVYTHTCVAHHLPWSSLSFGSLRISSTVWSVGCPPWIVGEKLRLCSEAKQLTSSMCSGYTFTIMIVFISSGCRTRTQTACRSISNHLEKIQIDKHVTQSPMILRKMMLNNMLLVTCLSFYAHQQPVYHPNWNSAVTLFQQQRPGCPTTRTLKQANKSACQGWLSWWRLM